MTVEVTADDMGWTIDLPCMTCGKMDCMGSVHAWLPNRQGNIEDGFDTEEEAIEGAETLLERNGQFCPTLGE